MILELNRNLGWKIRWKAHTDLFVSLDSQLRFDLRGDSVQIALALSGQLAAAGVRVHLDPLNFLQLLQRSAVDRVTADSVSRRTRASSVSAGVDAREATNTDRTAEVEVTSDRCDARVVPVRVERRELLEDGGLN